MTQILNELDISGVFEIVPDRLEDDRGFFARIFCQNELITVNKAKNILQMNISYTRKKGTIRGLHYQIPPFQEDKLVRCIKGSIYDVIVDLRKNSATYGKWISVTLHSSKLNSLYIPRGMAHGFQTLEDNCEVLYSHTEIHSPDSERGLKFSSKELGIVWPLPPKNLSKRDTNLPEFEKAKHEM